jgi:hypothetical protein
MGGLKDCWRKIKVRVVEKWVVWGEFGLGYKKIVLKRRWD